jgi:hypothetical protein
VQRYFFCLPLHPSQRHILALLQLGQEKLSDNSPGLTSFPQALQLGMSYEPAYIWKHISPGTIFTFIIPASG